MLSEAEASYYKHILLGKTKKFFKDVFAKGPEDLTIKISGDIIVMRFSGILRKAESELVTKGPDGVEVIRAYRTALFEHKKNDFFQEVETAVNRKVTGCAFSIDIAENTALCLLTLSHPV